MGAGLARDWYSGYGARPGRRVCGHAVNPSLGARLPTSCRQTVRKPATRARHLRKVPLPGKALYHTPMLPRSQTQLPSTTRPAEDIRPLHSERKEKVRTTPRTLRHARIMRATVLLQRAPLRWRPWPTAALPCSGIKDPHRVSKETVALCDARASGRDAGQPQNSSAGSRCRAMSAFPRCGDSFSPVRGQARSHQARSHPGPLPQAGSYRGYRALLRQYPFAGAPLCHLFRVPV